MSAVSSSHSFTAAALPLNPRHQNRISSRCARKSTTNNNDSKKKTLKSASSSNEFRGRRRQRGASLLEKNNALSDDEQHLGALKTKKDFEEQEQPNGIDGMTLWFALGFVFDFMTPSSAECRKIIRAAAEQNRVVLKNVSQWRKLQWEKAAKEHVVLRNAHTPLPGCRGYRVCWQSSAQNGGECSHGDLLLIFVPSTRKYHREEDFRKGFDCGPPQSAREKEGEESENDDVEDEDEQKKKKKKKTTKEKKKSVVKSAKEVLNALDRISKVNEQLWYVRERILKNGEGIDVDALAESTKKSLGDKGDGVGAPSSSSSMSSPSSSSSSKQKEDGDDDEDKRTEEENSNSGNEDDDDDSNIATMDKYGSPEQAWENGQGADAVSLWLRFNINFDFHGPAGFVNRSVVKVAAEEKGIQTSQCESWPKHTWIDVAERAGVTLSLIHI